MPRLLVALVLDTALTVQVWDEWQARVTIRDAQAVRPGRPAVLLTGHASRGPALGAPERGGWALVREPVTGEQLAGRIAALLEGGACGVA